MAAIAMTTELEVKLYECLAKACRSLESTFGFDHEGFFGSAIYQDKAIKIMEEAAKELFESEGYKYTDDELSYYVMPYRTLIHNHDKNIIQEMLAYDFKTLVQDGKFQHTNLADMKKEIQLWVQDFYGNEQYERWYYDENDERVDESELDLTEIMSTPLFWNNLHEIWKNDGRKHKNPVLNVCIDGNECKTPFRQLETLFGERELIYRITSSFNERVERLKDNLLKEQGTEPGDGALDMMIR
jgi:hypothetical protein